MQDFLYDIRPNPENRRTGAILPSYLGEEFRPDRFVLDDDAFAVVRTAFDFPDQEFVDSIVSGSDVGTLFTDYLDRHLQPDHPNRLSPFHVAEIPTEQQQGMVLLAVQGTDIFADDNLDFITESLLSVGRVGSIVISDCHLDDLEFFSRSPSS